jgi:hypothetical protein
MVFHAASGPILIDSCGRQYPQYLCSFFAFLAFLAPAAQEFSRTSNRFARRAEAQQ